MQQIKPWQYSPGVFTMIVGVVDNNEAISFSAGFLGLHIVVVDPMTRYMERLEVQGGIDEVNRVCVFIMPIV